MEKALRIDRTKLSDDRSIGEGRQPPRDEGAKALAGGGTLARGAAIDLDHFVERDGMRFAGTHLIADLWDATNLDKLDIVDRALRRASDAAGATLLAMDLHCFSPNGGITGVAVLAESHISIHTWPECAYAAVDVFMCGSAQPHKAIEVLRHAFSPGMLTISEHRRGVMP